jgi:hypothetical protein
MYNDPRITGNTQFLLRGAPPNSHFSPSSRRYWFTYQSGLYNADDTPKPAAQAYAMPLVPTIGTNRDGTTALSIWGQLRFRANTPLRRGCSYSSGRRARRIGPIPAPRSA